LPNTLLRGRPLLLPLRRLSLRKVTLEITVLLLLLLRWLRRRLLLVVLEVVTYT
jgi:hypothetical protein